jgi:hypothetical protein
MNRSQETGGDFFVVEFGQVFGLLRMKNVHRKIKAL